MTDAQLRRIDSNVEEILDIVRRLEVEVKEAKAAAIAATQSGRRH